MLMWRESVISVALFGLAVIPAVAHAQQGEEDPIPELQDIAGDEARLEVLQNRKYQLLHEIALVGGVFPGDAFYKGYAASAGYTLHFSEALAWEVVQFTYSFNIDTKLKKELIRVSRASQGDLQGQFPEITWMAASHLVLKPLYGKEALFNTEVVHLEVFFQAGPAFLYRGGNAGESLAIGLDVGFGVRFWLTQWASLRFDIYELIYFLDGGDPQQALHLHVGLGINLRGEE
jgi:outer membrane beta-barrel protein